MKRTVSAILLIMLLTSMLYLAFKVMPVRAVGTIYIKGNGSIDPPDVPISNVGNSTYTFTDDILVDADGIIVERDNIVIDGNGHTLQGPKKPDRGGPRIEGVYLSGRKNVTVRNMQITGFQRGILLSFCSNIRISGNNMTANRYDEGVRVYSSSNNSIVGNNIEDNWYGIWLFASSDNNTIAENYITASHYEGIRLFSCSNNSIVGNKIVANYCDGLWLYFLSNCNSVSGNTIEANKGWGIRVLGSSSNMISHNNFIDNYQQVITEELANCWDDGFEGNYWSDYIGVDSDTDGIGDVPYVIDSYNRDNHPFMSPYLQYDVNRDAIVDIFDIAKIAEIFGCSSADPQWNPHCDVNQDNIVDVFDMVVVAANFGKE